MRFALVGLGALMLAGSASAQDPAALAKHAYEQAVRRGVDLSQGPCLGEIKPGWVADIAHQPRIAADDLPQNQCSAYRSGQARHFVELDTQGRVIRVH